MVQITLGFFATPTRRSVSVAPRTQVYARPMRVCKMVARRVCHFSLFSSGFEVRWTHIYAVAQRHAAWHSFFGQHCVIRGRRLARKAALQAQCRAVCLVAASSPHDVPDCGLFSERTWPIPITFSLRSYRVRST